MVLDTIKKMDTFGDTITVEMMEPSVESVKTVKETWL